MYEIKIVYHFIIKSIVYRIILYKLNPFQYDPNDLKLIYKRKI